MIEWGRFERLFDFAPFMLMVDHKPSLNVSRIVEGLIIGLVAGAFAGYISIKELEVKVDNLSEKTEKLERVIETIRQDLYKPVGGK